MFFYWNKKGSQSVSSIELVGLFLRNLAEQKKAIKRNISTLDLKPSLFLQGLLSHLNKDSFNNRVANAEGVPLSDCRRFIIEPLVDLLRSWEKQLASESRDLSPTGLLVVVAPKVMTFRFAMESVIPALLAGNAVVLRLSPSSKAVFDQLVEIFSALGTESEPYLQSLVLCTSDHSFVELLLEHPSVLGVLAAGKSETLKYFNSKSGWKKKAFRGGGSNSLMILDWSHENETYEIIEQSVLTGGGGWPWNIKKILVLEKEADRLFSFLGKLKTHHQDAVKSDVLMALNAQVIKDQGRLVNPPEQGFQGIITRNLSHCSVLQQEEIPLPAVIVSEVKYLHEMIKWNNTCDLGLVTVICGDPEKAQRLAAKCETGEVWINQWLPVSELPLGLKASHHGSRDLTLFGDFYSDYPRIRLSP